MIPYVPPQFKKNGFNCPHCYAHSHQFWGKVAYPIQSTVISLVDIAQCQKCNAISFWYEGKMMFPNASTAPPANPDLPDDIKGDYDEASDIVNRSPRSACGLLRLCIEKLVSLEITGSGDLNEKIGKLVSQGTINDTVQKALDSVRVIGAEAIHPLKMDLKDDVKIATALFELVNFIADSTISKKKKVDALWEKLPKEKIDAVKKRDNSD